MPGGGGQPVGPPEEGGGPPLPVPGISRRLGNVHDIEGAEEVALQTFDPASFRVIMVEMDPADGADKDVRVDRLLRAAGMRRQPDLRVGLNEVYVRPDVEDAFRRAIEGAV